MRVEVKLPSLGDEGIEAVTVSQWLVERGAHVNEGDDLIEITTDKAAFTLPAPTTGTIVETTVDEGEDVAVGDVLCIVEV